MKQIKYKSNIFSSVIATVGLMLIVLICASTSTFAASISASPNPVCIGKPVTITLTDDPSEKKPSATFNGVGVTLTGGSGSWTGTVTATANSTAGTINLTGYNDDGSTAASGSDTVVELDDITFVSGPANSGWTKQYTDVNRDYAALKSAMSSNDKVTFGLDLTPHNATAATLVTWSGATASSDKLTATVPATNVLGPQTVTASACSCTTTPYTVWIFWGAITYNFSGGFDTYDGLSYASAAIPIPGSPTNAGPVAGNNGSGQLVARSKIEIIGTLQPAGVGNILGDIGFTFNNQMYSLNLWADSASPTDTHTSASGADNPPGFITGGTQQIVPNHDRIYAIDAPGMNNNVGYNGYAGLAVNFQNCIYIGTVQASDQNTWHTFTQEQFTGTSVAFVSTPNFSSGNPTLPTTWGASSW